MITVMLSGKKSKGALEDMGKQLAESVWEQTLENKESSKTFHELNQGEKFDMENYQPNNNQWGA